MSIYARSGRLGLLGALWLAAERIGRAPAVQGLGRLVATTGHHATELTFRSARAGRSRGGAFCPLSLLPIMAGYRKLSGDEDEWGGEGAPKPLSAAHRL